MGQNGEGAVALSQEERGRRDGRRILLSGRVLGGPVLRIRVGLQHRHCKGTAGQGRGRGAVRLYPLPLGRGPGKHHLALPQGGDGKAGGAGVFSGQGAGVPDHAHLHRRLRLLRMGADLQLGCAEHRDVLPLRGCRAADVLPLPFPAGLPGFHAVPAAGKVHLPGRHEARGLHGGGTEHHPPLRPGIPHRRRARIRPSRILRLPGEPGAGHPAGSRIGLHAVERFQ